MATMTNARALMAAKSRPQGSGRKDSGGGGGGESDDEGKSGREERRRGLKMRTNICVTGWEI